VFLGGFRDLLHSHGHAVKNEICCEFVAKLTPILWISKNKRVEPTGFEPYFVANLLRKRLKLDFALAARTGVEKTGLT
jgi:hypothetical protein